MENDIIELLESKITKSFNGWYFHDAIKSALTLIKIDSDNSIWISILEKAKIELSKRELLNTNKVRNEVIINLEKHINKSFKEKKYHEAIKFSLVLLEIDSDNSIWKNILEQSKLELSELCFSQWYIYWYSSYLDNFYDSFNYDKYQESIYLTYEDWLNVYKKKIKDTLELIFGIIILIVIFSFIIKIT